MLLLHATALRQGRRPQHDGTFHRRSDAARRRRSHYAGLRVLRAFTAHHHFANHQPLAAFFHFRTPMSHEHEAHDPNEYYVPHGSPWPFYGAGTLFVLMFGAAAYLNDWAGALGAWTLLPGFVMLALLFVFWFGTVIGESERGIFNLQVDRSFRMGMMWFIFSEVMFFAAFFGALFYARTLSVPWLGGEGVKIFTNLLLWKNYSGEWPTNGPAAVGGDFEIIPAFGLPALHTPILLSSGGTVTIDHQALRA